MVVNLNRGNNFRMTRVGEKIAIYLNGQLVFSEQSTRHRGLAKLGFEIKLPSEADQPGGSILDVGFRDLVVLKPN